MTSSGVQRDGAFEFGLGFRCNDAARRAGQGFAEIGPARGTVAIISDRIVIGPHRFVVAAQSRQHRRQHVPAATIGWIFLQMRFDLRHQIVERLFGVGRAGALRQRKIAEARRPEREVKSHRYDRQSNQGHDGRETPQPDARHGRRIALVVRRGQQTAADFDTRGLGFGAANQPRGSVAIDLGKLILVDGRLAAVVCAAGRDGSTARARRKSPRPSSARTQTTESSSGFRWNGAHTEAPMRRFTPPAASRAIDNCRIAKLPNWQAAIADKSPNPEKQRQLT